MGPSLRDAVVFGLVSSLRKFATIENLEQRRLLHAGHEHAGEIETYMGAPLIDGHVTETAFRAANPQFANVDLWNPAVFNPTNSSNRSDWLYDPHWVESSAPTTMTDPATESGQGEGGPEVATLPDLVPLTGGNYLNPIIDKTEIAGHNLMRFTTAIGNQGTGPAILTSANSGTPPAGSGISTWINADGTQNVLQRNYDWAAGGTNGTFTATGYRPAGRMIWHSGHGHFHLEGYASYRLLTDVGGHPGPVALRSGFDNAPAVGEKVGFCLVNILTSFTMTNGQNSSVLQGYSAQGSQSAPSNNGQPQTTCGFTQGIHVGHADVYDSQYDGQWIDVTGVPNGNYFLEVTLDALNVIQESDESNNSVVVPVVLNTTPGVGGIQPDRFEPNDTFGDATDLGVQGTSTQSGLTAHVSYENDYFRFTAASSGAYSVQVVVGNRDVNLYLYDQDRVLMGSATNFANVNATPVTKTINANFVAGQTYFLRYHGFGSDLSSGNQTSGVSSNYSAKININPTINASTPTPQAAEVGQIAGRIDVARNGPTSSPLTVNFTVAGTATRGVDYEIRQEGVLITGNTLSIGNEASIAPLDIIPLADNVAEPTETAIINLVAGAYVVGGGSGTVNIADAPPAVAASTFNFDTLPLNVSFDFTVDVGASLGVGDLSVVDLATNQPVALDNVTYDSGNNRGRFNFGSALPDGNYRATLSAAGVTHAFGLPLQADAVVDFFVFAGDANHDRSINIADFSIMASAFGQAGNFSAGDFNYDGSVNIADFAILGSKFNTTLAAARPSASNPAAAPAQHGGISAALFSTKHVDSTVSRIDLVESGQVI